MLPTTNPHPLLPVTNPLHYVTNYQSISYQSTSLPIHSTSLLIRIRISYQSTSLCLREGGFPSLRHNEVRDLTANLLSEVCNNVVTEPHLQPLSGETLQYKTANRDDNARLDIAANGFWGGRFERSYFDVRIFNPSAPSNQPLHSAYRRHDKEKRREYQQRVHEVENASFTPLIFTTTGGMGDAATQFYKRLANLLSAKHSLSYGIVMGWLRCKLSFSLLRSAIMCIRGARSSLRCPIAEAPIAVQVAEAHM